MAELAAILGLEKSTASGLVERGERRGLLSRAPSPDDGRAVHVSSTPEGAALAQRGHEQVRAELQPLDASRRDALAGLLAALVSATSG